MAHPIALFRINIHLKYLNFYPVPHDSAKVWRIFRMKEYPREAELLFIPFNRFQYITRREIRSNAIDYCVHRVSSIDLIHCLLRNIFISCAQTLMSVIQKIEEAKVFFLSW